MNIRLIILTIVFLILGWIVSTGKDKHQIVRLIDVFIYGPVLLYIAFIYKGEGEIWIPYFLILLGATTISYNLRNYLNYNNIGIPP